MDFLLYVFAGAGVGLAIGLTGVGGGSIMTPLLLAFGFPMHIAVGTDLLYAAITKTGGVIVHAQQKTIEWRLVYWLALGSLPASVVTVVLLKVYFTNPQDYSYILTTCLGVMLIATSGALIFRRKLNKPPVDAGQIKVVRHQKAITLVTGVILGVLVTLSSVGAGVLAVTALVLLYPALQGVRIVGTDIAHAVPLTLIAGLGHLFLGNVDFLLLGSLLIGSLPAIWFGTKVAGKIPEKVIRSILATTLLGVGIKFAFY